MKDCIFCKYPDRKKILENDLAFAIYDKYPVNQGHMLLIPKRHFPEIFMATQEEALALHNLTIEARNYLMDKYNPDGFNIGANLGEVAGQTIFHLHIHIIPRYLGDVKDPRGGIRNFKENIVDY